VAVNTTRDNQSGGPIPASFSGRRRRGFIVVLGRRASSRRQRRGPVFPRPGKEVARKTSEGWVLARGMSPRRDLHRPSTDAPEAGSAIEAVRKWAGGHAGVGPSSGSPSGRAGRGVWANIIENGNWLDRRPSLVGEDRRPSSGNASRKVLDRGWAYPPRGPTVLWAKGNGPIRRTGVLRGTDHDRPVPRSRTSCLLPHGQRRRRLRKLDSIEG